jgi:hypothetical protein
VSSLYPYENRPKKIVSVIGGLGGKDITESDFVSIIDYMKGSDSKTPLYLFGQEDQRAFQKIQEIANVKKEMPSS